MFEKFGKMDYEELIRTAAAEREEGDLEALVTLAVENGLEKEDAEDYMDYIVDSLQLLTWQQLPKSKVKRKNWE